MRRFAQGVTLAAVAAVACTTKLTVSADALLLCERDNQCPDGWGCEEEAGLCVKAGESAALPVSSLVARSDQPSEMTLTWDDPNGHTTGFDISRGLAGSPQELLNPPVDATESSFTDTDLQPDSAYTYTVVVTTTGGRSRPREVDGWTVPLAPAALVVTTVSATELRVQWTDTSAYEQSYLIERSDDAGPFAALTTLPADREEYLDSGLGAGVSYAYRVYVIGPGGRSPAAEGQARAAFEPVLDWSAALTLDTSCNLTAVGTMTFDTDKLAAEESIAGDIDGADNVVADASGVSGDIVAFDFDARELTWSVSDTLGSVSTATRYARIVPTALTDFAAVPMQPGVHLMSGQQHWSETVAVTPPSGQCASCSGPRGSISVRQEGACVLGDDTGLRCWGRNGYGSYGNGTTASSLEPVDVCEPGSGPDCGATLTGVTGVVGQYDMQCALMTSGEVFCWGNGLSGGLGTGDGEPRHRPAPVCKDGASPDCDVLGRLTNVTSLAMGNAFSCAVVDGGGASGEVWCWGKSDNNSALGDGTKLVNRFNAGAVCTSGTYPDCTGGARYSGAVMVAAGDNHACAVESDSRAVCWGESRSHRLGHDTGSGNGDPALYPADVCGFGGCSGVLTGVVSVAAGAQHSCALLDDGRVACWGKGANGEGIGIGLADNSDYPALVLCHAGSGGPDCEAGTNFQTSVVSIAASGSTTCALLDSGQLKCWGKNDTGNGGMLGDGTAEFRLSSVYVCESGSGIDCPRRLSNIVAVDVGRDMTCAVQGDGTVLCWGEDIGVLPQPVCDRASGLGCEGTLHAAVRGCFSYDVEEL